MAILISIIIYKNYPYYTFYIKTPEGMAAIPGGSFIMGSKLGLGLKECLKFNKLTESRCNPTSFSAESPAHMVFVDPFYIDKYEVTQKEFQSVFKINLSDRKSYDLPVVNVTWYHSNTFCMSIGKRLPSEAEWEKVAKAENNFQYPWGNNLESPMSNTCDKNCDYPWKREELDDGFRFTSPVGSFPKNSYGVYDMAGNVFEWVNDWYTKDYYANSPKVNPLGPPPSRFKVLKGGSWLDPAYRMRSSGRIGLAPTRTIDHVGFRCAKSS